MGLGIFKLYFAVIFMQASIAGKDILYKTSSNQGMSSYAIVVYRNAIATIVMLPFAAIVDRKLRPKMTMSIFIKIMLLGLLEPVGQILYFLGMKYTTTTFAAAMYNILPAITFFIAWIFRLEKANLKSNRTYAKIIGTLASVAGAMIMTLVKGPMLPLSWTKGSVNKSETTFDHNMIKGGIMIIVSCFCGACFGILQAVTLSTYPVDLSLTFMICLIGTLEGVIVTSIMEKGNPNIWAIKWDTLLIVAYSGIVCSGLFYYLQGVVMKDKGPVFVNAFSPLAMIIVAIMASFILKEPMFLGMVIGAIIIIVGLYLVLWGKSKDDVA